MELILVDSTLIRRNQIRYGLNLGFTWLKGNTILDIFTDDRLKQKLLGGLAYLFIFKLLNVANYSPFILNFLPNLKILFGLAYLFIFKLLNVANYSPFILNFLPNLKILLFKFNKNIKVKLSSLQIIVAETPCCSKLLVFNRHVV